ncbi:MAG: hypothetical protein GY816_02495 [Cytophagales bacterium]|nr:hypothetical protein [Cytophagales bacterium]
MINQSLMHPKSIVIVSAQMMRKNREKVLQNILDEELFKDIIQLLSILVAIGPEIEELDFNPL